MARSAILGNGRLTVGLDERGLVHDFYYPYVGLENLTSARSVHHKIGVWVNGVFSWTDSESWSNCVDLSSDSLTAKCIMTNKELGVTLRTEDFVDNEYDIFCRQIYINNTGSNTIDLRLFMHQVFQLSGYGRSDTALYEPDGNYILDYKGRECLLISGVVNDLPFDQYAVGNYGIEGKAGTYMDAEDGELSGHAVEHAGVDSAIRFSANIRAGDESRIDYWIIAGDSQLSCETVHNIIIQKGFLKTRIKKHEDHWNKWLSISDDRLENLPGKERFLIRKSLMTIKAHIDQRGGIIASCDSSIYNYGRDYYSYVWPRDGAYAIWPLIRLGYYEESKSFIKFCRDIITKEGFMMHKYQPDRAIGSTWHPLVHGKRRELAIQEDETAIVLFILGEYYEYSGDKEFVKEVYDSLVVKAADFLSDFIDIDTGLPHASYDLWEEKFLTTTYTTAVVYAGLQVASGLAKEFGNTKQHEKWSKLASNILDKYPVFIDPERNTYRKGFLYNTDADSLEFDNTVDISSMYGVITFNYIPDSINPTHIIENTMNALAKKSHIGGFPRYQNDKYFEEVKDTPNPWLVTTLWAAQYYIRTRQYELAKELIEWAESMATPSGMFSEQVHPDNGTPKSVTPLVWSHAEYINTLLDLSHRTEKILSDTEFDITD